MIRILQRNGKDVREFLSLDALTQLLEQKPSLVWIDIFEQKMSSELRNKLEFLLNEVFTFHPLAVEDLLQQDNTPKVDDWDRYLYIVLHGVRFDKNLDDVDTSELDIFLGANYLITFREEEIPAIDRVWKNALRDERHTRRGPDYLLYEVCDNVAADYLPCMDAMDEEIDAIETKLFERLDHRTINRIFKLKSAVLNLRRVLSPQREVMNKLSRDDYQMIDPKDRVYFRDVYDHFVRMVDLNEALRDLVTGALDTYLSLAANRTNDVVKTLTIITLLFMPLTFITGFFGMNFFADSVVVNTVIQPYVLFAFALLTMILTPVLILLYIRRRGWW
jgi:magnesium transporter